MAISRDQLSPLLPMTSLHISCPGSTNDSPGITRVPILRSEDVMLTGVCLQNFTDINIHKYIQSKRFKLIQNFEEVIHAHQLPIKHWQETFSKMNNSHLMGDIQAKFTRVRRTQWYTFHYLLPWWIMVAIRCIYKTEVACWFDTISHTPVAWTWLSMNH